MSLAQYMGGKVTLRKAKGGTPIKKLLNHPRRPGHLK